jgi:hypothetical protein
MLDQVAESLDHALAQISSSLHPAPKSGLHLIEMSGERLTEEVFLAAEVVVGGALGHGRGVCNLLHRDAIVASLEEEVERSRKQPFPAAPRAAPGVPLIRHGRHRCNLSTPTVQRALLPRPGDLSRPIVLNDRSGQRGTVNNRSAIIAIASPRAGKSAPENDDVAHVAGGARPVKTIHRMERATFA